MEFFTADRRSSSSHTAFPRQEEDAYDAGVLSLDQLVFLEDTYLHKSATYKSDHEYRFTFRVSALSSQNWVVFG